MVNLKARFLARRTLVNQHTLGIKGPIQVVIKANPKDLLQIRLIHRANLKDHMEGLTLANNHFPDRPVVPTKVFNLDGRNMVNRPTLVKRRFYRINLLKARPPHFYCVGFSAG
jgi:hypothetical protein